MYLKYIDNNKYINKIEELYLNSFPEAERFPFWILEKASKENNSDLYAIIDNDKFIGMCYLVNCDNAYYLMYLAVEPSLRNKNYGSKILKDLKEKYKVLFLSVDEPVDNTSIRRKNFYLRNGFYDTNKFYEDTGVSYEVLCTNDKYEINDDIMKMRYTNMTNNARIFEVISNTFDVNIVNLKNKNKGSEKMSENKESLSKVVINWFPGHMQKAKRLIKEKYDLIDIVYELVDARIPYSSKIKDIDELIKNKKRILIMTKKDLCDLRETNKWVKHYENLGYKVILADLNDNSEYKKIIDLTHEMTKDIQDSREAKGLKKKEIKALVIGIPNVGKSTLINKLVGKKVAVVGNRPGVTTSLNWLKTSSDILLLDTPGILWPKFDNEKLALNLASMSAIRSEILNIDELAVHILTELYNFYPELLMERYKIDNIDDMLEVYNKIGKSIGAYRNGEADFERVSNKIINDLKNEYIKGITFDRCKDE